MTKIVINFLKMTKIVTFDFYTEIKGSDLFILLPPTAFVLCLFSLMYP